jgi:hypothetical protein
MFLFSDRATSSRLAQYRRETLQKALRLPAEAAFAPADGAALGVPLPHAASSSDIAAASAAAQPAGRFWIRSGIGEGRDVRAGQDWRIRRRSSRRR